MWNLIKVSARNICAFKEFSYEPAQGVTTLVFGVNLDDDSQDSNGSGKSALVESIAIALLGSPLRKAKLEEVINDRENEAAIEVTLKNPVLDQTLVISRILNRKTDQKVALKLNDEDVVMPNVAEYNRYVLEAIGLSRDQILTSFILCAYHFHSFLDASDKDKKEIINRFSNGAMVDQSIAVVHEDVVKAKEDLAGVEREHAVRRTRVETLRKEIEDFDGSYEHRENRRKEMIEAHKDSIARLREAIRNLNTDIDRHNEALDKLDEAEEKLNKLEGTNIDINITQDSIRALMNDYRLRVINNRYFDRYLTAQNQLTDYERKYEKLRREMSELSTQVTLAERKYQDADRVYQLAKAKQQGTLDDLEDEKVLKQEAYKKYDEEKRKCESAIDAVKQNIRHLNNLLASSITCPKCKHNFILNVDKPVSELKKEVKASESNLETHSKNLEDFGHCIAKVREELVNIGSKVNEVKARFIEQQGAAQQAKLAFDNLNHQFSDQKHAETRYMQAMESARDRLTETRKEMFDEAFEHLNEKSEDINDRIDKCYKDIDIHSAQIKTYEDAIVELENTDINVSVKEMKEKLKVYEDAALETASAVSGAKANVERLTSQESRFVNFKTYLANKKIEALSQETNSFLDHIGSSLRIRFSGYTVLKTGKIRDKISISMERDGIDCGSFGKLSVGERSRGILANVLAMHKLCNANCPDGRGLNFLILDEILDSTDETGISRTADVLSDLGLTSILITHIPVAEDYPHRLIVQKKNGTSTLKPL